ncbi:hypothetical protein [Pedobacter sp.]
MQRKKLEKRVLFTFEKKYQKNNLSLKDTDDTTFTIYTTTVTGMSKV